MPKKRTHLHQIFVKCALFNTISPQYIVKNKTSVNHILHLSSNRFSIVNFILHLFILCDKCK